MAQHGQDAQQDSKAGTVENRARAGTSTWPGRRPRPPWSGGRDVDLAGNCHLSCRRAFAIGRRPNSAPAAMVPWLAVAYGFGDVQFISPPSVNPRFGRALALASIGVTIAIMARRRSFGFPIAAQRRSPR